MPTSNLNLDDLSPGLFVASTSYILNLPPGTPFRVSALSLPFISIQPLLFSGLQPPIPVNATALSFYRVDPSYLSSFTSTPPLSDIRGRSVNPSSIYPPTP